MAAGKSAHEVIPLEKICRRLSWEDLDGEYLCRLIQNAKEEDLAGSGLADSLKPKQSGDLTSSLIPQDKMGEATLLAKQELIVCGMPLVPLILGEYGQGCVFESRIYEGQKVTKDTPLGTIRGTASLILMAERIILNFLQHLCGISTLTHMYTEALSATSTRLLDTRKTTPCYRYLEKYAVACGGGWNHRLGLFDWPMLKDNHIQAAAATGRDSLKSLVEQARKQNPGKIIEVEVDQLEQIDPVIEGRADLVLLDNFAHSILPEALRQCEGRIRTEASGGISLNDLEELGSIGLDFISTGATVHQSQWVDIGLEWNETSPEH